MMSRYCRAFYALWIAALLQLAGCNGESNPNPPTYQVVGKVTFRDQPVPGASIIFNKLDNSRGAVGETDEAGEYKLTTYALHDGAPPGEYRVQIMRYEEPPPNATEAEMFHLKNLLPAKYADSKKSGLKAAVQENDSNVVDFVLQ
jgi:hypothetical protein